VRDKKVALIKLCEGTMEEDLRSMYDQMGSDNLSDLERNLFIINVGVATLAAHTVMPLTPLIVATPNPDTIIPTAEL
jgi:hypothetical protein